ncbi:MAG: response regulator transcription factor [Mycobacterium leprae]
MASTLFISEKTAKNHLTHIFEKLGVSDRTQAALYAVRSGLVKLEKSPE